MELNIIKSVLIGGFSNDQKECWKQGSDELRVIRLSFSYRFRIEEALNKLQFKEGNTHEQNIQMLFEVLDKNIEMEPGLKKRFLDSFGQFLKYQQNIPIEVNLKKIRYEQLTYLIDQWENSMHQPSLLRNPQRLYSIQHRNILFSRVFFQQKQSIEEYFSTLNDKKMLKGVDLYQLLGDILSPYYLYEFSSQNETFFQKVNSFNNFLEVVEKFINSQRRIIVDNKSKDFEFIKLYEFEALIYYWQSINTQLQLRSDKRFSYTSKQVQTERNEIAMHKDTEVQTVNTNEKAPDLQKIINLTLKQLNTLTENQSQPEILQIIQNLCQALRLQKISLNQFLKLNETYQHSILQHIERSPHKRTPSNQHQRLSSNYSEHSDLELQKTQRISMKISQSPQQKRGSASKRKNQSNNRNQNLRLALDKNQNGSDREQINHRRSPSKSIRSKKQQQKRRKTQQIDQSETQQIRANEYIIQNLHLSNMRSDTNEIQQNIQLKRVDTITQNTNSIFGLFQLIYQNYTDQTTGFMNIQRLNRFFVDIGIIQEKQSLYELKCLRKAQLKNPSKIRQVQFLQVMGLVMKADEDLTFDVIAEFVDLYVNDFPEITNINQINVKINGQSHQINPTRFSENRSYQIQKDNGKTSQPLYTNSVKKQGFSSSYNQNFTNSKSYNFDNQSRRKRYAYCQDTPKFQQEMAFNRFTQTRNQVSKQKKTSLPVPGYRKYPLQKY